MTTSQILQGDALSVLKTLESGSVQCCITSPPYYGLRCYGTDLLIWGGDADCDHVWGDSIAYAKQDMRTREQKIAQGAAVSSSSRVNDEMTATATSGAFCSRCSAWKGELGLEPTMELYVDHIVEICEEVKRVLRDDGTFWLNLGDSYSGSGKGPEGGLSKQYNHRHLEHVIKPNKELPSKSLMNIPYRVAIALTDRLGLIQRNCIIWHKPSAMPSSAKDRFTVDFEPIFFFTKSPKYKFNQQLEPVREVSLKRVEKGWKSDHDSVGKDGIDVERMGARWANPEGRNKRSVWTIPFEPQSNEHYASYPTRLIEPMLLAGSREGDTILDPFNGTGTTGLVALRNNRNYIGIELNPEYIEISEERLKDVQPRLEQLYL